MKKMKIRRWTKEKKKIDVFKMKMVIGCKKNQNDEVYIITWWIGDNLPIITSRIRLWNERDGDHILNETDVEDWSF